MTTKKRCVLNLGTEVSNYYSHNYKHVEAMLYETRRVMKTKKHGDLLSTCGSCFIPYNVTEPLDTSLICYTCPMIYHCGRSFCVKPFNICVCVGCNNNICKRCINTCEDFCCVKLICDGCTILCESCDSEYCIDHVNPCEICRIHMCLQSSCRFKCVTCNHTVCRNCIWIEEESSKKFCKNCA